MALAIRELDFGGRLKLISRSSWNTFVLAGKNSAIWRAVCLGVYRLDVPSNQLERRHGGTRASRSLNGVNRRVVTPRA